ncbi:hypothetical protein GH714_042722 [Hevea brasiliensis]|uniref:Uncharacterized protein n=1 Tax=Hevea brasiliensis TaxID=3981 RepID=A0A6A6K181_HEVBR|nr:hypothetical protein GH714_042722 [Hevea brasiliensis]
MMPLVAVSRGDFSFAASSRHISPSSPPASPLDMLSKSIGNPKNTEVPLVGLKILTCGVMFAPRETTALSTLPKRLATTSLFNAWVGVAMTAHAIAKADLSSSDSPPPDISRVALSKDCTAAKFGGVLRKKKPKIFRLSANSLAEQHSVLTHMICCAGLLAGVKAVTVCMPDNCRQCSAVFGEMNSKLSVVLLMAHLDRSNANPAEIALTVLIQIMVIPWRFGLSRGGKILE